MSDVSNPLQEIGAALASAASDAPLDLNDEQRNLILQASLSDVLDAIVDQLPAPAKAYHPIGRIFPMKEEDLSADEQDRLRSAAAMWADECRKGFSNPTIVERIGDAVASEDPLRDIAAIIRNDDRLASDDRDAALARLASAAQSYETAPPVQQPAGAYLSSIRVAGFRGIGPAAEIAFDVGPSLTIVYGANGSGKSSFVEALDVLLTGNTGRFDGRGTEWTSALANVHAPTGGSIDATFTLGGAETDKITLTRRWTDGDLISEERDEKLIAALQQIGWLDALDRYRPILGYAELGPLFDEVAGNGQAWIEERTESPLARHIRMRAGTTGASLANLLSAAATPDQLAAPFHDELTRWYILYAAIHTSGHMDVDPRLFEPINGFDSDVSDRHRPSSKTSAPYGPAQTLILALSWIARVVTRWPLRASTVFVRIVTSAILALTGRLTWKTIALMKRVLPMISRGNSSHHSSSREQNTRQHSKDSRGVRNRVTPRVRQQTQMLAAFPSYTSRARIYCEMLAEATHEIHLREFSKRVAEIWKQARPGSAVRFERVSLRHTHTATVRRTRRVSLDLRVDDAYDVERGVLSQGELHALALSVFLPTMMRPESPFKFAMIDDPVQAMDEHAVDGLAEVLEDVADDLQVIVFTHDKRLIEALDDLSIKHTLINVMRSGRSVVECETVGDPVIRYIDDAREAANRPPDEDEDRRMQYVAHHCRQAIDAACMRAAKSKLVREGKTRQQIDDKIKRAMKGRNPTTKAMMALAIFGDADKLSSVMHHVTVEHEEEWGPRVKTTVKRLNTLAHSSSAKIAIRTHRDDLNQLIDDTEFVIQRIEANCG